MSEAFTAVDGGGGGGFWGVAIGECIVLVGGGVGILVRFLKDLPKATGNSGTFEADTSVVRAVDITNEHVHGSVVAMFGHSQHFVKGAGFSEER